MTRTKQAARGGIHKNKKQDKGSTNAPPKRPRKDGEKRKAQLEKAIRKDITQFTATSPIDSHQSADPPNSLSIQDTTSIPNASRDETVNNPLQALPTTISIPLDIQKSHTITTHSIISSTSIQKKVTAALSLLSTYPPPSGIKPNVVVFYAKAQAAAKMISTVEIVKREIGGMGKENGNRGGKWFQYNCVEGVIQERREKERKGDQGSKGKRDGDGKENDDVDVEMGEGGDESEGEAFEVMKTPFERALEGTEKVRVTPIMSIYLSRTRIESLRREYGEQTNALELPTS